jgi:chromosomal replication initiation ATPase DnaA
MRRGQAYDELDYQHLADVFSVHYSRTRDIAASLEVVVTRAFALCSPERAPHEVSAELARSRFFDVTAAVVLEAVAALHGVTARHMFDYGRLVVPRYWHRARAEAAWLMRMACGMSYPAIGRELGRGHQPMIHAVRKIQRAVDADPAYGERLLGLVRGEASPALEKAA